MRRDSLIQLGALGVLIAAMVASVFFTTQIAASQGRNKLVYTERAEDGDPPEVGLGIAMGAFRGMFVNFLWIRANQLKEAGKYYEAIDLASTITKLQPRFPRVWVFHAWNMAYNISVATQTKEERWQWVNAGIALLRDKGIPANPNDLLLHKELSWIFLHKVQGVMDDANQFYKRKLAEEWTIILSPPPARTKETRSTDKVVEAYVAWLERMAGAYDTLSDLYAAEPKARELVERLRSEAGVDVRLNADRARFLRVLEEQRSLARIAGELKLAGQIAPENLPIIRLMVEEQYKTAFSAVVRHVRKRVVVDVYHMEPDRMIRYTKKYGPMDWRNAAAHAVYWAARGVEEASARMTEGNENNFDFVNTDRLVIQGVQELYRYGTIQFDILSPEYYFAMPCADFIPAYGNILDELTERELRQFLVQKKVDISDRVWRFYSAGYENFLSDAIRFLYRRGQLEEAKMYQKKLYTAPWLNRNDDQKKYKLTLPIDQFVVEELKDRVTTPYVALDEIFSSLYGAFVNGILAGDDEMYESQMRYARMFHQAYMNDQYRITNVDPTMARMEVFDKDFNKTAGKILASCIMSLGRQEGAVLFRRIGDDNIKLVAYDILEPALAGTMQNAEAQGAPGFNTWFPAPAGLEAYRKAEAAKRAGEAGRAKGESK